MKVPLGWLAEFVDLSGDVASIVNDLVGLGHQVDGVETVEPGWTGVDVAEVLTVEPHPDADRIRVCTVTTGGDPITVICGAWNFGAGDRVAFARPGAVLPGDFEIGVRTIRGVESNGMICSEKELGIGDDHAGILVLDRSAPVGTALADVLALPETVLELDITPNRPDAMSVLGLARDLAALHGLEVRTPTASMPTVPGTPRTSVEVVDTDGCLRFTGREVQDVTIGPSPVWMRQRLRMAGMRPISNAVDVTNYVMLELGHPLHAFDAERIAGDRLVIRRGVAGEHLVTLDDVDRVLDERDLVIADDDGATSLAGTMGGARSEVVETTTTVFVEAATWDPARILHMSRRHGLRSEASARFERGVDPALPLDAAARAAGLLAAMTGGLVLDGVVDEVARELPTLTISLTRHEVERVLGQGFDEETIAHHLRALGFEVEDSGSEGSSPLTVSVPTYRPDVERPIDLVEEVARLHGYERFQSTVPTGPGGGLTPAQRRMRRLRTALQGLGISQTVHLSFMAVEDLDVLGYPADDQARQVVQVKNPLRSEESVLRTTLIPGLLRTVRYNRSHGRDDIALFETGKVFFNQPDPTDQRIPHQPDRVAVVMAGAVGPSGIDLETPDADVYLLTAVWRVIASQLGIDDWSLMESSAPGFHPGRCAALSVGGEHVGVIGEIHPVVAAAFDIEGRVAMAELDLMPLVERAPVVGFDPPSTYPHSEFDLAFVVAMPAADLVATLVAAGGELVETARVFDEYSGLEGGRRSLAVHIVLRAPDRTLSADDIGEVREAMITAAENAGAELRGT